MHCTSEGPAAPGPESPGAPKAQAPRNPGTPHPARLRSCHDVRTGAGGRTPGRSSSGPPTRHRRRAGGGPSPGTSLPAWAQRPFYDLHKQQRRVNEIIWNKCRELILQWQIRSLWRRLSGVKGGTRCTGCWKAQSYPPRSAFALRFLVIPFSTEHQRVPDAARRWDLRRAGFGVWRVKTSVHWGIKTGRLRTKCSSKWTIK